MSDNTTITYTSISERLQKNAGLKLTEEEFKVEFPEVSYSWRAPLRGDHPFIIPEDSLRIVAIYDSPDPANPQRITALTLVSFWTEDGTPLETSR